MVLSDGGQGIGWMWGGWVQHRKSSKALALVIRGHIKMHIQGDEDLVAKKNERGEKTL